MRVTDATDRVAGGARVACFFLALLLVGQLIELKPHHGLYAYASWSTYAPTPQAAAQLSSLIVVGHVESVSGHRGITVMVPGEPNDQDRVAYELVRIGVDKLIKGDAPAALPLFHTALEPNDATPEPQPARSPPAGATPPPAADAEVRRVLLDDDPPYEIGQHYLLFLTRGPNVQGTATVIVVAPEGRYLLDWPGAYRAESHLHAVTRRAFAPQFDDHPVGPIVASIPTSPPQPPSQPSPPSPPSPTSPSLTSPSLTSPTSPTPKQTGNNTGRTTTKEIIGGAAAAAAILLLRGHGGAKVPRPVPSAPSPNNNIP